MTTFVIMPLGALALALDLVGLGLPFWWLAGQGISAILALAHFVSDLPGAVSMMPEMPIWSYAAFWAGALLFGLLQTHIRYVGIPIFLLGIAGMILAPRPDILVTGDGKHLALVAADGKLSLLRGKAGDFVRDMISEKAGSNAAATPIEQWPGARCTSDNRTWTILATRTAYRVPAMEMAAACRRVDIVMSDRWLPQSCRPKWIKADRGLLEQTGGLAIYLAEQRVITVNENRAHMPWVQAAKSAQRNADLHQ
jgi:competence protein ComEC